MLSGKLFENWPLMANQDFSQFANYLVAVLQLTHT